MAMSAIAKLRKPQVAKIVDQLPAGVAHWGPPGTSMVIATPQEVDEVVAKIPKGKVATINDLRNVLATRHGTTIACPVTTGIFLSVVAKAAAEMEDMGAKKVTPWWRVIKSDGTLNDKMPGGRAEHCRRLEEEGISVHAKGKSALCVTDFEQKLARL